MKTAILALLSADTDCHTLMLRFVFFILQPHEDESQDNVGTGAEISTKNDVPANVHDGPDGAPQIAPAVALPSPTDAQVRRSSTLFSRRDDNPLNAAADAAPTVAGAAVGAIINRVQYRSVMRGWEDYVQINPMCPFAHDSLASRPQRMFSESSPRTSTKTQTVSKFRALGLRHNF